MAGTMVEKVALQPDAVSRRRRRLAVPIVVLVVATLVAALTATLVIPRAALSHGLRFQTYSDARGLNLGLHEMAERARENPGAGGGGSGTIPVDRDRRFVLVTAPFVTDRTNPSANFSCCGVVDTAEERVVASVRFPKSSTRFFGIELMSSTLRDGPAIGPEGDATWSVNTVAKLPSWWPYGERIWTSGYTTETTYLNYDPFADRWNRVSEIAPDVVASEKLRWVQRLNRTLILPGLSDELVAEHEPRGEYDQPSVVRLARRGREDGTVRWEVKAADFPEGGLPEATHIELPIGAFDRSADWCLIIQHSRERLGWIPRVWRLDLDDGRLTRLEAPITSAADYPEVASDGQTIVFRNNSAVRELFSDSDLETRYGHGQASSIVTWHPEHGARRVFEPRGSDFMTVVLPRRRVLVVDSKFPKAALRVLIVPLDENAPRQIYP